MLLHLLLHCYKLHKRRSTFFSSPPHGQLQAARPIWAPKEQFYFNVSDNYYRSRSILIFECTIIYHLPAHLNFRPFKGWMNISEHLIATLKRLNLKKKITSSGCALGVWKKTERAQMMRRQLRFSLLSREPLPTQASHLPRDGSTFQIIWMSFIETLAVEVFDLLLRTVLNFFDIDIKPK